MSYYNQGQAPIGVPPPQGILLFFVMILVFLVLDRRDCGVRL